MNSAKPNFPWFYLLLAYGLAWLFWIPIVLTGRDFRDFPLLLAAMFLGTFGPGIAGIILTYREQSRNDIRDFWRRVFDFRPIRLPWYGVIFLLFPALQLAALAINAWIGGNPPEFTFVKESMAAPVSVLAVVVLYGLQAGLEELGWRGYMLDRLQRLWNPLVASLVLGLFHTVWHLPTFWVVGTNQYSWKSGLEPLAFIGFVISGSIFSTWCYNDNHRSILATILLHSVGNLAASVFALTGPGKHIYTILLTMGAAFIAIAWILPIWEQKRALSMRSLDMGGMSE